MSDPDDEAPEELALSVGKKQAATLRHQERASEVQQKELRGSRHKRSRTSEPGSQPTDLPKAKEAGAAQPVQDALPDDVIEALTSSDRGIASSSIAHVEDMPQHPSRQVVRKKRLQQLQRNAGPVTVRVLNSGLSGQPSESAIHFMQQQLHANKKRSVEMLQPCCNWSGRHSKTIRSCSGPALQFVKSRS